VSRRIYLDFNASTPICPEAVEAMRLFLFEHYGNPSSLHWAGMPAKDAVERARGQVAARLGGLLPSLSPRLRGASALSELPPMYIHQCTSTGHRSKRMDRGPERITERAEGIH
jgi:hypothetical protein